MEAAEPFEQWHFLAGICRNIRGANRLRRYNWTGNLRRDPLYGEDRSLVRVREVAHDGSLIVTELARLI